MPSSEGALNLKVKVGRNVYSFPDVGPGEALQIIVRFAGITVPGPNASGRERMLVAMER